jgi:RNA chaperone Hfq
MKSIEELFLKTLINEREYISVYLTNGIHLKGYLLAFDAMTLVLTPCLGATHNCQLVYKNSIGTVQKTLVATKNHLRKSAPPFLRREVKDKDKIWQEK